MAVPLYMDVHGSLCHHGPVCAARGGRRAHRHRKTAADQLTDEELLEHVRVLGARAFFTQDLRFKGTRRGLAAPRESRSPGLAFGHQPARGPSGRFRHRSRTVLAKGSDPGGPPEQTIEIPSLLNRFPRRVKLSSHRNPFKSPPLRYPSASGRSPGPCLGFAPHGGFAGA